MIFKLTRTSPKIFDPPNDAVDIWSQFELKMAFPIIYYISFTYLRASDRIEWTLRLHWTEQAGGILLKQSLSNASMVLVWPSTIILNSSPVDNWTKIALSSFIEMLRITFCVLTSLTALLIMSMAKYMGQNWPGSQQLTRLSSFALLSDCWNIVMFISNTCLYNFFQL